MQTKISGFQVDFCKVADNFDCCFLFSITVASVEVWCAVVVQQKNFYYPPSPQNRCECVTTAIMFYQVARFNLIKNLRDTTVCWFYFFSSQIKNMYCLICERHVNHDMDAQDNIGSKTNLNITYETCDTLKSLSLFYFGILKLLMEHSV